MKYYAPTKISENMHETPEGYLLCVDVPIARTGAMEYGKDETPLDAGPDGIITISREEDEVFDEKTIASFEGKPFTIRHPEQFVDAKNWSILAKGTIQNVRRGDGDLRDWLVCNILITDSFAISLVKGGVRGLSCGYEAGFIQTGEGKGKQIDIVGNHLALVEEGRAGDVAEIKDSKGVFSMGKKLADKLKEDLAKVVNALVKDEEGGEKKDDKAKDAESAPSQAAPAVMDELKMICDKLSAMADAFMGKKEEKKEEPAKDEDKEAPKKDDAKDDDVNPLEERMKALEAAVAKLLEAKAGDEDMDEDVEDEDGEEEEAESEDADEEVVVADTGDEASRAEILAPGIKKTKNLKVEALKACYQTRDGKTIIESLTGGKRPDFDKAENVATLFVAASEILKAQRGTDLVRAKATDFKFLSNDTKTMTAEQMNDLNKKHYNLK